MIGAFYNKEEQTKFCVCVNEEEYLLNKKYGIIKNNRFDGIPIIIANSTNIQSYEHKA